MIVSFRRLAANSHFLAPHAFFDSSSNKFSAVRLFCTEPVLSCLYVRQSSHFFFLTSSISEKIPFGPSRILRLGVWLALSTFRRLVNVVFQSPPPPLQFDTDLHRGFSYLVPL